MKNYVNHFPLLSPLLTVKTCSWNSCFNLFDKLLLQLWKSVAIVLVFILPYRLSLQLWKTIKVAIILVFLFCFTDQVLQLGKFPLFLLSYRLSLQQCVTSTWGGAKDSLSVILSPIGEASKRLQSLRKTLKESETPRIYPSS